MSNGVRLFLQACKMRMIAAVLFFAAASISTASAQSSSSQPQFSSDHGHAGDAAAAARRAVALARAKEEAIAAGLPLSPSQSTNFAVNGDSVIRAAPRRTVEEEKADEEGRAAWQARCRPTVIVDREGMRRTKYAAPDCDLSRFNTAGVQ
jgi:hypothetical protein